MITTPQALAEVLTQNSYDYVKPALLRYGLGRVLGVGLILAEGDEHKVSTSEFETALLFIGIERMSLRRNARISCRLLPIVISRISILCSGPSRAKWSKL